MSKSSARNGDRDKTTGSEISCGNYVTAYENMALPKYLMQISSQNDLIMEMDVEEELNERVNGGDQDDDGDNARYFYDAMKEVELERSRVLLGDYGIQQADEGGGELCIA